MNVKISEKLAVGEDLNRAELEQLAESDDILTVGALADDLRRRMHGRQVTYVRVARCALDAPLSEAVPPTAGEIRLGGTPASIDVALEAVHTAKSVAGTRLLSGFSLPDLQALAGDESLPRVLADLRAAGLEMIAEVALDRISAPETVFEMLAASGFDRARLTLERAPASNRIALFLRARALREKFGMITVLNPLPVVLDAFRPTTGYEDTKTVALARLSAPNIASIQVDWSRYGPKLAQVALTFGADDLDNVSPDEETAAGPRRSPHAEVRRNIEAAGFVAAERDGHFRLR